MDWPPSFVRSRVAVTEGGYHSTTRGTVRLVFPHKGKWLVFRGGPNSYHFSEDGLAWTSTEAPQAGRSHLIMGDTIFSRYDVLVEGKPVSTFDHFIARGSLSGERIRWEEPCQLETRVAYYPDLKRDARGYFTMTGRAPVRDEAGKVVGTEALWTRSARPNDISEWGPELRFVDHTSDRLTDDDSWKRIGSTVHENLVLENGTSYAFAMMTVGGKGRLYGNLHDGRKWREDETELSTEMSTWSGTDRRFCAVFDPAARVIHLGCVTGDGRLLYRTCRSPYRAEDWSEPVQRQPFETFTVVLGLDTSTTPAQVYLLFGKTLFENQKDLRSTFGELYLQRLVAGAWSDPVLVSEPGTRENWYPNMNEEVGHGVGILYLSGSGGPVQSGKPPLDIMFSSTGAPR
jgi:hypothetical protein